MAQRLICILIAAVILFHALKSYNAKTKAEKENQAKDGPSGEPEPDTVQAKESAAKETAKAETSAASMTIAQCTR